MISETMAQKLENGKNSFSLEEYLSKRKYTLNSLKEIKKESVVLLSKVMKRGITESEFLRLFKTACDLSDEKIANLFKKSTENKQRISDLKNRLQTINGKNGGGGM